jgi:hypothetical protein
MLGAVMVHYEWYEQLYLCMKGRAHQTTEDLRYEAPRASAIIMYDNRGSGSRAGIRRHGTVVGVMCQAPATLYYRLYCRVLTYDTVGNVQDSLINVSRPHSLASL